VWFDVASLRIRKNTASKILRASARRCGGMSYDGSGESCVRRFNNVGCCRIHGCIAGALERGRSRGSVCPAEPGIETSYGVQERPSSDVYTCRRTSCVTVPTERNQIQDDVCGCSRAAT